MQMQKLSHQTYCFDGFTLDVTRGFLLHGQEEIKLRPKSFEVLKYLVKNNARLISKDELIHAVWGDTAVTDDSLAQCLRDVRRALCDETQQIIRTVHGRGYILDKEVSDGASIASVTTLTEETAGLQLVIEEEERNGHGDAETRRLGDVLLLPASQSKVGYLVEAIQKHKWAAAISVLTLAMAAAGIFYLTRPAEAIDSVAVMPFVNVSGDPNTEYLSEGVSDSIINRLSQLPNLKVIALSSTMRYKGREIDPQAVGRDLNVKALLTGRIIQHGDDISISTELVDVRDNRHLWGGQYNRKLANIITVQMEIAQEVSQKLGLPLSGDERKRLTKRYTESNEAYQLYVMGRYFRRLRSEEGFQKSVEFFEQAIKEDPNYAPAYAGLAMTYAFLGGTGMLPPKEALQKEEWAALKALEIDSDLAEAHVAMAALVRKRDLNWSAS
jgi:TolB-like protein/DNA-binding winged helix-turn-helix (wHTH) protein